MQDIQSIVDEYHGASKWSNYVTLFLLTKLNGMFEVKFIANDNVGYSSETVEVYVNSINDNPYLTGYQNISFNEVIQILLCLYR